MAVTKHERRLQRQQQRHREREQQRDRLQATLADTEHGKADRGVLAAAVAAAVAAAHGGDGGAGGDNVEPRQEKCDTQKGRPTQQHQEELPKPTEDEAIPREANTGGTAAIEERRKGHATEANQSSPPRRASEDGDVDGSNVRNEDAEAPADRPALESELGHAGADSNVMEVSRQGDDCADRDDADHEPESQTEVPLASSLVMRTAVDASLATADKNQLVAENSLASPLDETIAKEPISRAKKASYIDPDDSKRADSEDPEITQLDDAIQILVRKKQKEQSSRSQPVFNPPIAAASSSTPSPTPSEAATDATETPGVDESNFPGDTEDHAHGDSKTARIRQLELELALAERKVNALEAEKSTWVEAADKQRDYRSQLLAAQVNQRTLAKRLRRVVQSLDDNVGVSASRSVIELYELVDVLGQPHIRFSNQPDAIDLSNSIVFPPQKDATGRAGNPSTARSWLYDNQSTDYSIRVMRLSEIPLKRHRGDSFYASPIAPPSLRHEENTHASVTSHTVQFRSPPQLKRQRMIDDGIASSDEEEFECDVDSTGKVTARTIASKPTTREDPGADDSFLALSM